MTHGANVHTREAPTAKIDSMRTRLWHLRIILEMFYAAVGEDGWTVSKPLVEETLGSSWAGVKQGKFDWPTLFEFVVAACMFKGYGGRFEKTDNALLGISELTDAELQTAVDEIAKH